MKLSFALALLAALSPLTAARASACPGEIITSQSLVLMGRGFAKKRGPESIALACTDTACKTLRFVYFENARTACFFGDSIVNPTAPTEKLHQEALQVVTKDFFYNHHTQSSAEKIDRAMKRRGGMLLLGLVGTALIVTGTGGVGVLPMLATGTGAAGLGYLLSSSDAMESVVSGAGNTATLNDENGWSWAGNPKKVRPDVFRQIAARIQHGKELQTFNVFGSFDRAIKMKDKISRMQGRLYKKDVKFYPDAE